MPLFEDTISIPCVGNLTTNVHLFRYGLPINKKASAKKLICTDLCMSFNRNNFQDLDEEQKKSILNNSCVFDGFFVRTISGPYDLCLKIWATEYRSTIPSGMILKSIPEPDPSVAVDAIVVDHIGEYYGVCSGPHLGFCKASDLKLAGVTSDEITLPFGGIKLHFQKTKSRPSEIPYSAYQATFVKPEIIAVPKTEKVLKIEEVKPNPDKSKAVEKEIPTESPKSTISVDAEKNNKIKAEEKVVDVIKPTNSPNTKQTIVQDVRQENLNGNQVV